MDQIKIGKFLAELRKREGLSQEALGEKIGVTNKTISRWETGTYMPDIEMFQILSKLYSVSLNELLCGAYLSDEEFREKSDENVGALAEDNKKALRKVIKTSVAVSICAMLAFLTVFAVRYITTRSQKLYHSVPALAGSLEDKAIKGSVTVPAGEAGDVFCQNEKSGIRLRFSAPGYSEKEFADEYHSINLFLNEETSSWISVRSLYISEDPCPSTFGLDTFFKTAGIYRFTDKVKFAIRYDLDKVTVFSSDADIDIAAGCRMILSYGDLPNRGEGIRGEYHEISGKWDGYMVSNGPPDMPQNVWSVVVEDNYRIIYFIIKDDEQIGATAESVAEWLSSVEFVD